MIFMQLFHVLPFLLFLLFSFSFAHFHDVTPYKEVESKSSNSPSSAPSPSPSFASFGSHMTSGKSSENSNSGNSSKSNSGSLSGSAMGDSKGSSSSGFSLSSSGSGSGSASGSFKSWGSFSVSGDFDASKGSISSSSSSSGSGSGASTASGSASSSASAGFTASASSSDASTSEEVEINFSGSFSVVFAFGDSYTDTGNAQLLGILKTFVGAFLARVFQGMNSNFYKGSRSSNGRLVVDFLCDSLNISSLQPYKAISENFAPDANSGVNFAIGGATSLSADFFANHRIGHTLMWKGIPLSFQTQIEWYNSYLREMACKGKSEEECKQLMATNLIWLGQMGVNDFARVIGSSISMRWLTDITISHISKILTTVLDSGAKFVVVQGLPPVGCCPLARLLTPQFAKDEMGCTASINRAVMEHNELLQKTLEEFRKKYPDCVIAYADYFNAYKTIMGNLGGFGFSEGSKTCCGFGGGSLNFNLHSLCGMPGTSDCTNPAAHIHWDGIHLTEAMHRQITRLFLHKGFCKPSFADLVKAHANLRRQQTFPSGL